MILRPTSSPRCVAALCLTLIVSAIVQAVLPDAAAACNRPLPVGDEEARRLLREERPFAPTDRDLFHSFVHPDWIDAAPIEIVDGPALSEEETREELRAFLERRFPCAPRRVQEGLAVYGDPYVQQKRQSRRFGRRWPP